MKKTGIRIVVLLVLQALWLGASHSGELGSSRFSAERSKQEAIYHGEGDGVVEGYTVDRSLSVYAEGLCTEFDRTLANLGPKDRWLDIGAGKGYAILDYYTPGYDLTHPEGRERRGKKARAVAISIEDRRTPLWRENAASLGGNQIQYLFNRRLQEYSSEDLGEFRLITDVIGGFSYTENLSLFVEKVLGFLELNGSFYTLLQDVNSESGTNRPYYADSPFLTEIANASGSEVRVCSWLKSITCVEVACELKMEWKPPVEAYHVRKTCNDVTVPALIPITYEAGTPPQRRYQLRN
ncbi:MAG: hypothetical protein AAB325_04775 [Pseudomonadota bacterium]